jgi:hypothetical protein
MEVTKWLKPLVSVSRYTVTARACRPSTCLLIPDSGIADIPQPLVGAITDDDFSQANGLMF